MFFFGLQIYFCFPKKIYRLVTNISPQNSPKRGAFFLKTFREREREREKERERERKREREREKV